MKKEQQAFNFWFCAL